MSPPTVVPVSPAVARALDALALPGETRTQTVARIVWAFGTAETRQPDRKENGR